MGLKMKIRFTKMQGAGNDFVVLDETQGASHLSAAHYRYLANRHFGVGADQILTVRKPAKESPYGDVDFQYIIHNADGSEVEQCGNGARCFARFVYDKGLTNKKEIKVQTKSGVIAPRLTDDGRVRVNMGSPRWQAEQIPFDPTGLQFEMLGDAQIWSLPIGSNGSSKNGSGEKSTNNMSIAPTSVAVSVVSMGNPHAVQVVGDVDTAAVEVEGPLIEQNVHFPQRVNAGFMQVLSPNAIKLRVYERGAGETLACGTGACAAVVCGIRQGRLASRVDVSTRGGMLTIEWGGDANDDVYMTGPAVTVFEGIIEIPELL